MRKRIQVIAEQATFRAFVNCYLREVDGGQWGVAKTIDVDTGHKYSFPVCIILHLNAINAVVILEVAYRSDVGCHHFGRAFFKKVINSKSEWQEIEALPLLAHMVRNIYQSVYSKVGVLAETDGGLKRNELELGVRLLESYQLMAKFLEDRAGDASLSKIDFISTEQSVLYGHWLHPTPKSRQGMTFWQQSHYSPELKGRFRLHYFSVDISLIQQRGSPSKAVSELFTEDVFVHDRPCIPSNHILVPSHPLQAQYLLLQDWVRQLMNDGLIKNLGPLGDEFQATSSVRTLYRKDCPWMYKFSIPVKITNSLRINKCNELEIGMAMESYMSLCGFLERHPGFNIIDDPAYLTVVKPGKEGSESGFEVLLRRNPFKHEFGDGICSILALVQEPLPKSDGHIGDSFLKSIILNLAKRENRPADLVAMDWFKQYFVCAIEPMIALYEQEGIALEAHQQNSLLDVADGYPRAFYYRDNQGFYLSKTHREKLQIIANQLTMADLFYDDEEIFEAISYYLIVNQLFSVIYRLGVDGLVNEKDLISYVKKMILNMNKRFTGLGKRFANYLISSEFIAYKGNLMARVRDVDELDEGVERAVYFKIKNPLCQVQSNHHGLNPQGNSYVA